MIQNRTKQMIDEETKRKMRGIHSTYYKPQEKEQLSYWLAQSGKDKLNGYCGKYTGENDRPCINCGHAKKDHKIIEVADCVYFGTDSFGSKRQTWRVETHYRRRVHPHFYKEKPDGDWLEQFTYEFIEKTLLETKLYAREANPEIDFTYCFVWEPCDPEKAEAVGLVAVCGAIAPLECCEFDRVVSWSPEHIQQAKDRAKNRINSDRFYTHSDFMWTDEPLPQMTPA